MHLLISITFCRLQFYQKETVRLSGSICKTQFEQLTTINDITFPAEKWAQIKKKQSQSHMACNRVLTFYLLRARVRSETSGLSLIRLTFTSGSFPGKRFVCCLLGSS